MESYQDKANTLAQRFGISPVEAMKAVEECDGDILDAVSLLECKGVIRRTSASYRSGGQNGGQTYQGYTGNNYVAPNNGGNSVYGFGCNNNGQGSAGKDIKTELARLFALSVEYKIAVVKNGRNIIALPIIAIIALLICAFWFVIPAAVIGFFAGCRYEIVK